MSDALCLIPRLCLVSAAGKPHLTYSLQNPLLTPDRFLIHFRLFFRSAETPCRTPLKAPPRVMDVRAVLLPGCRASGRSPHRQTSAGRRQISGSKRRPPLARRSNPFFHDRRTDQRQAKFTGSTRVLMLYCAYVHLSVSLSVCLSVCLTIHLLSHPSVHLSHSPSTT